MKLLRLRVAEARPEDVYRKVARLSHKSMVELNAANGDFIEISSPRGAVVCQAWHDPDDEGSDLIRVDGHVRQQAGAGLGEYVAVRKVEVSPASRVVLAPVDQVGFDLELVSYLKQQLLGRPLSRGELIAVPVLATELRFLVASAHPSHTVYVTDETRIVLRGAPAEALRGIPKVTWEDIGGLEEAKAKIREVVELPIRYPELFRHLGIEPPKGVLLYGPPGTGKTLLAKALANEVGAYFISINGPEIMSKFYGESEARLREIFREAEENAPSIVFIDEIDAIAPRREEVTGELERRVVAQLLALMDGLKERGRVIVIAATNRVGGVDPALRRPGRFDREIETHLPDRRERLEILRIHTRSMPLAESVRLDEIADATHGYTGADLAALAREAAMNALRRVLPKADLSSLKVTRGLLSKLRVEMQDFLEAMKHIQPTLLREVYVEVPEVHWSDIGGLKEVKQVLRESVEAPLRYPEVFREMGIEPPRGILLYGPPGTGKTLLAKAVATESGANFICIRGPELLSKWVGESEKAVREVFRRARQVAPCVIFFDEVDAIAPARGTTDSSGVAERVVNQLLTEMDGIVPLQNVIVLAATNKPEVLDPALLRPGRLEKLLYVPPPDLKARAEIFQIHTRKMPLAEDVDFWKLAEMTEGYTGADIAAVCREAAMIAIRGDYKPKPVGMRHFAQAIRAVPPSLSRPRAQMPAQLA
ncbi:MAG: AAA family ATPase [Thermoproteota archaeon]|nr:MAG: AAA family ATPase [Candidatus Korarchaeota archaeon]